MIEFFKTGYIAADCDCSGAPGKHLASRMDDTETLGQFWKRLFSAGWRYSPITGKLYCPYCAKGRRWLCRKVRRPARAVIRRPARGKNPKYTRRYSVGQEALTAALAGFITALTQKLKD